MFLLVRNTWNEGTDFNMLYLAREEEEERQVTLKVFDCNWTQM